MNDQKFKEEYAKLNPKQKEAVDTIEGPVMVIAGPGTGKTTILTLRIANILRLTDTPPSGILALTFTESGVKNMRAKLREIIGNRALEVPIHTFHGFASSVINEFKDHFPRLAKAKQITEVETESLIREILQQTKFAKLRPLGDPDFYIGKIINTISDAKREAWDPEMIGSFAKTEIERIKNDESSISTRGASKGELKGEALKRIEKSERTILFAKVYAEYEKKKAAENKIDFDDLIFELLQALKTDKLLLQLLQEKFIYILLDEHQDTNDSQNLIVRHLANFFDNPNLFVVGDEKQAIYRFQGASVENFLSFERTWQSMKIISLDENYRSHQNILDSSFKLIEQNYGEGEHLKLRVKLSAAQKETRPIELNITPDIKSENWWLATRVKEIAEKEKGVKIAVIVRKNNQVSQILSYFESRDIKATAEKGADIFSHHLGVLFFDLLEFISDQSKTEALAKTILGGLWHLSFTEQVEILKIIRSGDLSKIINKIPVDKLQKPLGTVGVLEYLNLIAQVSGFVQKTSQTPLGVEIWRVIFELARDLAENNNIEDPKILINKLLDYQKSAERKIVKIKSGDLEAPILITTSHSSKGLEFDYVFLPYATEEAWLSKNHSSYFVLPKEKDSTDNMKDERRLFYVALTRAKKHIVISYARENGLGKMLTPLRFLEELGDSNISKNELKESNEKIPEADLSIKKSNLDQEKIEYIKAILRENGLSVTALNHFLTCPNKFFYKSILKLPEAPNPTSEKGTAMHEALSSVWRAKAANNNDINHQNIDLIIKKVVSEYFGKSLLPKTEKELVLEELLENAPIVARSLETHFKQAGATVAESWVESYFNYTLNDKTEIELRLHGKMDAITEGEKEILVFDYKTKEVMSEKEIRGETQNSDGGYFRQLVFYKILLANNFRFKNKNIEPELIFIKPNKQGNCPIIKLIINQKDEDQLHLEIKKLLEAVWSGQILEKTCDDEKCQFCALAKSANLTLEN